jgi:hypothetical protein
MYFPKPTQPHRPTSPHGPTKKRRKKNKREKERGRRGEAHCRAEKREEKREETMGAPAPWLSFRRSSVFCSHDQNFILTISSAHT